MTAPVTLAMRALKARLQTINGLTVRTGSAALDVDGESLPVATLLPQSDRSDDERLRFSSQSYRRSVLLEIFVSSDLAAFDEVLDALLFDVRQCLAAPPGFELLNGTVTWETQMNEVTFTATPDARMATAQIPITLCYLNAYTV